MFKKHILCFFERNRLCHDSRLCVYKKKKRENKNGRLMEKLQFQIAFNWLYKLYCGISMRSNPATVALCTPTNLPTLCLSLSISYVFILKSISYKWQNNGWTSIRSCQGWLNSIIKILKERDTWFTNMLYEYSLDSMYFSQ